MIQQTFFALPQFLSETDYRNPTDPDHAPWHLGHKTDLSPFAWLQQNSQHLTSFLPWMTHQRAGLPIFLDVLDFKQELVQGGDPTVPVFVDVGGAMGHQCLELKVRFPEFAGRIVLQDQPYVIDQVQANPRPEFDGIKAEVYDFFTPQPVKGNEICI
jgi:hypothetical protein